MSAPPAPVVQPVSLMNQLTATASTNAASAVSAYSGPADAPSPMPRPESAIQDFPKTGPYQRNPMTIAAAVAMTIAIQFMYPSSTRAGAEPPQRLGRGALGPGTRGEDRVGDEEEVRDVVREPARARARLTTPGHAAHPRERRDEHERNDGGDRYNRDKGRAHLPILLD